MSFISIVQDVVDKLATSCLTYATFVSWSHNRPLCQAAGYERGDVCYLFDVGTYYGSKHEILFFNHPRDSCVNQVWVSPALPWVKGVDAQNPCSFDDDVEPARVANALDNYFRSCAPARKIWTLREAYEQNKTLQRCCVCGKPTETRSLCLSRVQYCRCIESLNA